MIRLLSLLAALSLAATPARAADTLKLSGKWRVDYGEAHCVATGSFGTGEDATTLLFQPSLSGAVLRLVVTRPGTFGQARHEKVALASGGRRVETSALTYRSPSTKQKLSSINLASATQSEVLRQSGPLAIEGAVDGRFDLPGMGQLLDALETCRLDVRQYWNADGVEGGRLSQPARPKKPLVEYLKSNDYPAQALSGGMAGRSKTSFLIDETGKARSCMVEESSGFAALDAQTCALFLARAEFTPALDPSGTPVKSVLFSSVNWVKSD